MDQHDPTRRQYQPNAYAAQQQQQQQQQAPATATAQAPVQYAAPNSVERFRQSSYLQQPPTSTPTAARAGGESQQMYGFTESAQYGAGPSMPAHTLHYAQGMQSQDSQRQQQAQQYAPYASVMVYSMPQPQAQQPSQSAYEQMPQYRQRPSTSSETFTAQYSVSQNPQYYLAGQPGPTSAPAPEPTGQQMQTQYQQAGYPQPGSSVSQPYPSTMIDPTQSGGYQAYVQQPQYTAQQQQAPNVDQAFNQYQMQVRNIFTNARDGSLRDVAARLVEISHYLLGNAPALGLTRDDEALHDDRIRLWDEFNRAWLASLQKQFDMTQAMLQTGQQPQEPQSIISAQELEHLSRELVRLCDSVETHGLVDYQMGVAEEEIMDLLLRCLALLDPSSPRTREVRPHAESSAAGAARGR